MKDKRFVVYSETGTNTHHYFATYKEARDYVVNKNDMGSSRIAYLLAYSKSEFVELSRCKVADLKHSEEERG